MVSVDDDSPSEIEVRRVEMARLAAEAVSRADIAVYTQNMDNPPDIEYRVEGRIKEHSDTIRLWQHQLDETCEGRSQIETAIGVCNNLGSEAEYESSHAS